MNRSPRRSPVRTIAGLLFALSTSSSTPGWPTRATSESKFARAPYIFMMDADNLVYPGALLQLLTTIKRERGRCLQPTLPHSKKRLTIVSGCLSYYDWDPQILVQHPYIDAMAMFRRDVLRIPL